MAEDSPAGGGFGAPAGQPHLPPFDDTYTGPRWRYGLVYRPLVAGTANVPRGWILHSDRPHPQLRHGTVDFPRELTPEEVARYELLPLGEEDRLPGQARVWRRNLLQGIGVFSRIWGWLDPGEVDLEQLEPVHAEAPGGHRVAIRLDGDTLVCSHTRADCPACATSLSGQL